jgi:SAM-dependent methyltransferase
MIFSISRLNTDAIATYGPCCSKGSRVVLDAGVGTGRNIPFYPADAQVTGIDISPAIGAGKPQAPFARRGN